MFGFSGNKDMKKEFCQLQQMGDQRAGRWGAIPKIASPMKSMPHMQEGGSRESSGKFMSNTYCQEI